MVMGKCEGEQRTWQIAKRSPLAWAALSGCGLRNTWVECLKDSSAKLRKELSTQLVNFAVRDSTVVPSHLPWCLVVVIIGPAMRHSNALAG